MLPLAGKGPLVFRIYSINDPGHLFNRELMKVGAFIFPAFSGRKARTFLENNEARENKFTSLQQDKTTCKS